MVPLHGTYAPGDMYVLMLASLIVLVSVSVRVCDVWVAFEFGFVLFV